MMAQKLISSAILIAIMCQFSEQNPISESKNHLMDETYDECNSTTTKCMGTPTGCVAKKSCVVLLSATPTPTGAEFMLHWARDSSSMDKWVAAGLSADKKMGDDSVTECILVKNQTKVIVRQGLTYCNKTESGSDCGVDTVEPVKGITKEIGTYNDDVLTCSWTRAMDTMVKTLDFNIQKNSYHILLAYGPTMNDKLKHHTKAWVSKNAFILGEEVGGSTTPTKPATNPTTAKPSTANRSTAKPSTANPTTPKPTSVPPASPSKSTGMPASTMTGNTTMTMPSNATTAAGNATTPHSRPSHGTTHKPNGSTTITFGLSLGIFVTIVLSLNL